MWSGTSIEIPLKTKAMWLAACHLTRERGRSSTVHSGSSGSSTRAHHSDLGLQTLTELAEMLREHLHLGHLSPQTLQLFCHPRQLVVHPSAVVGHDREMLAGRRLSRHVRIMFTDGCSVG